MVPIPPTVISDFEKRSDARTLQCVFLPLARPVKLFVIRSADSLCQGMAAHYAAIPPGFILFRNPL